MAVLGSLALCVFAHQALSLQQAVLLHSSRLFLKVSNLSAQDNSSPWPQGDSSVQGGVAGDGAAMLGTAVEHSNLGTGL